MSEIDLLKKCTHATALNDFSGREMGEKTKNKNLSKKGKRRNNTMSLKKVRDVVVDLLFVFLSLGTITKVVWDFTRGIENLSWYWPIILVLGIILALASTYYFFRDLNRLKN